MFEELCACLSAHRAPSEEEMGRVLDQLQCIPYFRSLYSSLGADYLLLMVPLLEPYLLRQGLALIGENSQYVLLEGELNEVEEQYQASRPIERYRLLDLRERKGVRFEAQTDCKIVRIRRGTAAGLAQFQKRLLQKERERNQEMAKLRKLIKGKEHRHKLEFLKAIDFFGNLGEFDLMDLAVQSRIQDYSQGSVTHSSGEEVEAIGCVLAGKVKLSYPNREGLGQEVCLQVGEGEWVGLEEYLWEGKFRSSGEAVSVSATVVWVPREVFHSKFSLKTNYRTMSRLMGLVQAKKILLDRSLECRRRKQAEILAQDQRLRTMNQHLLQKITAIAIQEERRRKNNFHKAKATKEFELPEHLLHRSNLLAEQAPSILPKLF